MKYLLFSLFFVFLFSVNSCGDKQSNDVCSETLGTGCVRCCDEVYYSKYCAGQTAIIVYKKTDLTKPFKEYTLDIKNADSFIALYKKFGPPGSTCVKF